MNFKEDLHEVAYGYLFWDRVRMAYKFLVVGGGGVGKSASVIFFVNNVFVPEYDPTIEDCFRTQKVFHGETCVLNIVDTAEQEGHCWFSYKQRFYKSGDAIILYYSISNKRSFKDASLILADIAKTREQSSFPLVVVGSKCDLEESREVTTEQGRQFAENNGGEFLESSAKLGMNVGEIFYLGWREIKRHRNEPVIELASRNKQLTNCKLL